MHLHSLRMSTPGMWCEASRASERLANGPCQRAWLALWPAGRFPVVIQSRSRHLGHFAGNFVRGNRNYSCPAERNYWERDGVVSGKNQKVLWDGITDFGDLRDVAAGLFHSDDIGHVGQPRQRTRLDVGAGTSGNVVKNDWLLDRLGNGAEMAILAFLCGFVVIGRGGENCVYPRTRRGLLRFHHRFVSRV